MISYHQRTPYSLDTLGPIRFKNINVPQTKHATLKSSLDLNLDIKCGGYVFVNFLLCSLCVCVCVQLNK